MKHSEWFDVGKQLPWEPGVYEARSFAPGSRRFHHWDCKNWGPYCSTAKEAARWADVVTWYPPTEWRGVLQ